MSDFAQLQYVCPNCFTQRAVNDVLFQRNVRRNVPDIPKLRFWNGLHPGGEFVPTTRCTADWRQYPVSQREVQQDVVTALRDYNGDRLTVRICPECDYPTASPMDESLLLLSWGAQGMDFDQAQTFFQALSAPESGFSMERLPADVEQRAMEYIRVAANGGCLLFPCGLAQISGAEELKVRYAHRANAALLWLRLEAGGPQTADYDAVQTVLSYTEACGEWGMFNLRPVAVLLSGDAIPENRDAVQGWLEQEHHNLFNALGANLGSWTALNWQAQNGPSAKAVAEWLLFPQGRPETPSAPVQAAPQTEEPPRTEESAFVTLESDLMSEADVVQPETPAAPAPQENDPEADGS
ncbi:MAG: hypothetical protein LUD79_04655 [Oscillospiraceae bacterium]|nr:hypothetical protein [Oscillospiraceae bacterium]